MRTTLTLTLLSVLGLAACSDGSADLPSAPKRLPANPTLTTTASATPSVIAGHPTCAQINPSWNELRIDPPTPGWYESSDGLLWAWLVSTDGIHFDWTARVPPAAVLLAGSASTNVYAYTPPATGDQGLQSPEAAAPAFVSFCYDTDVAILYGLQINPTAFAIFRRTWSWSISKYSDQSRVTLSLGQQLPVNYSVSVDATNIDSDQHVYGDIFVTSDQGALPDVGLSVTVKTDIDQVILNCSVGGECHYYLRVSSNDANQVSATVRATSGDEVAEFPVSLNADFSRGEREEIDASVIVTDDKYGELGVAWAQEGQTSAYFEYSRTLGPFATCGRYSDTNTASFVTMDSGKAGSAGWTVLIELPCATQCALGYGYWKTHSRYGPAPYDDTWALLGEDTPFFLSGASYYQVLWTPPAGGKAYYELAHPYIAARLNILNGVRSAPIQGAMASAAALLITYTPEAALSKNVRAQFIQLAAQLARFNEGSAGSGECFR